MSATSGEDRQGAEPQEHDRGPCRARAGIRCRTRPPTIPAAPSWAPIPETSAVNRYLQSWDVSNVFVMGASAFPQNAAVNPTGTVGALAYWAAEAIRNRYIKNPGAAGAGMKTFGARLPCLIARCCALPRRRRSPTQRRGRPLSGDPGRLHGLPYRAGRQALCRRRAAGNAVRQDRRAQHHARQRHRHRQPGAKRFPPRRARGHQRPAASGFIPPCPIPPMRSMSDADVAASVDLYADGCAGARRGRANLLPLPLQHPRPDGGLELALFQASRVSRRLPESRRPGIAAPIWSPGPAIAAPAIRPKPSWARIAPRR